MAEHLMATRLSAPQRACLFKLEQQMVRQKGFINRDAFTDEQNDVFNEWQQEGHIELDADEVNNLPKEEVDKMQLTHSCHLSNELWATSACLRRLYAYDL